MTALAMPFDELAFHETILTARVAWAKDRRAKYRRRILTLLAAASILSYATHPPPPLPLVGRDITLAPSAGRLENHSYSSGATNLSSVRIATASDDLFDAVFGSSSTVLTTTATLLCYDGKDWDRCVSDDSTATTELSTVIVQ